MSVAQARERSLTRRQTMVGTATVVAPSIATVATAQTDSGNVEVETVATIPSGTSITVEARESELGSTDTTQQISVDDGTNTYEFDELNGVADEGRDYHFRIDLESNSANDATPEMDTLTITLPEAEPDEPQDVEDEGIDFSDPEIGFSVFSIGLLAILLAAVVALRNWLAGIMWTLSIVVLLFVGLFNVGIEAFWMSIVATLLLIVAGMIVRAGQ